MNSSAKEITGGWRSPVPKSWMCPLYGLLNEAPNKHLGHIPCIAGLKPTMDAYFDACGHSAPTDRADRVTPNEPILNFTGLYTHQSLTEDFC